MDVTNVSAIIIERDVEDEPIWITVGKYALFMSYGKVGIDAKSLYEHYQFTSLLQKTNSVWAADKYCRKGLDWGRDRFDKAKALLIDLDLITITQTRKEDGTFGTTYIRVHTRKVALEPSDLNRLPENPQADKPASGKTTPNALTNNRNALTNNVNALTNNALKDSSKRNELIKLLTTDYYFLYSNKLVLTPKELGAIKNLLKFELKDIHARWEIFKRWCKEKPQYYSLTPMKFYSQWNNLVASPVVSSGKKSKTQAEMEEEARLEDIKYSKMRGEI